MPWYSHLPDPKTAVGSITVEGVCELVRSGKRAGVDFVVVDVRVPDELQDMIPHAINLPAQTIHATLPVLRNVLDAIPLVVFHCNRSLGRGPRAAGWYADHLVAAGRDLDGVKVLEGGIVAWRERVPESLVKVP